MDATIVSDNGYVLMSTYVDFKAKLENLPTTRPTVLVKGCEAQYAMEISPMIRLSQPRRFQTCGEALIEDDQEGQAHQEESTVRTEKKNQGKNQELVEAVAILGGEIKDVKLDEKSESRKSSTQKITHTKNCWIFCTSIQPDIKEQHKWLKNTSEEYDHITTIRQPRKFAQALGLMVLDQLGHQDISAEYTYKNQEGCRVQIGGKGLMIWHGPVYYVEDVYETLNSMENDGNFPVVAPFIKSKEYENQHEYRFVIMSQIETSDDYVDLYVSGMLRDCLSPCRKLNPDTLEPYSSIHGIAEGDGNTHVKRMSHSSHRKTETEKSTYREAWTIKNVSQEGNEIQEQKTIREGYRTFTTETVETIEPGSFSDTDNIFKEEIHEVKREELSQEEGKYYKEATVHECIIAGEDWRNAEKESQIDEDQSKYGKARDEAKRWLQAMQVFHERPINVQIECSEDKRARETSDPVFRAIDAITAKLQENKEIGSKELENAAWHSLRAIWNLYLSFGEVIDTIDIERGKFVVIGLSSKSKAEFQGSILVGPHGTFAYRVANKEKTFFNWGGIESETLLFPDDKDYEIFKELGVIVEQAKNEVE